jgi:phospholipid N-methyltransferase
MLPSSSQKTASFLFGFGFLGLGSGSFFKKSLKTNFKESTVRVIDSKIYFYDCLKQSMTHVNLFHLFSEVHKLLQDQQKSMISKISWRLHLSKLREYLTKASQMVKDEVVTIG